MAGTRNICKICEGPANGLYFGATACHSCRLFFRRSCTLKLSYICRRNGNCNVSNEERNTCRSCRYKRCILSDMRFHDDEPSTTHEADRSLVPSTSAQVAYRSDISSQQLVRLPPSANFVGDISALAFPSSIVRLLKKVQNFCAQQRRERLPNRWHTPQEMKYGPESLQLASQWLSVQFQSLVDVLKQARFFAALPVADQVSLLRGFAPQFVILEDLKRSTTLKGNVLMFDEVHYISKVRPDAAVPVLNRNHNWFLVDVLLTKFQSLNPDELELALLCGILLWRAVSCSVQSKQIVDEHRSKHLLALELLEKTRQRHGRLGELVTFLNTLEQHSANNRHCFQMRRELFEDPLIRDMHVNEDSFPSPSYWNWWSN